MDLVKLTRKELLEKCEKEGIVKYKSKTKNQLIDLISKKNGIEITKHDEIDLYENNKEYIIEYIKDEYIIKYIKQSNL